MNASEELKSLLTNLYAETSKHAQYQTLPEPLAKILQMQFQVNEEWRGDRPRYPVIISQIPTQPNLRVLDVGANTGFFSLSIAHDRPKARVTACELNTTHARIIGLLAEVGGYGNVKVIDTPANLDNLPRFEQQDCILHLNILHHAGHDFDREHIPNQSAYKKYAIEYLRRLGAIGRQLIFQMGYNHGGNKATPLVPRDDQAGKVEFTLDLFQQSGWTVDGIAFAGEKAADQPIAFDVFAPRDLPPKAQLQDWLKKRYGTRIWSEFYQRPIWFCRR